MPTPLTERMGTETGWITMGEVEVGTVLFDEHGLPTTVTAVYDVWPEQAWRIWFSDGTHVDACGDHLWVTLDTLDRKRINRAGGDIPYDWASKDPITTAEMVSTITRGPRGDRNHCIPVTLPLQTDALSLLVDPWVLGYWLGNGSIRDGTVTVHNEDEAFVRDRMLAGGYRTGARYLYERAATFSAFGLRPNLRAIGVLGDKHVPERYLRASEAQRRALLAGLLDSDGHSALTGQIEFSSKDETLANGVAELARSLGQKPVVVKGTSTLYGVEKGPRYRVRWRPTENLFTSPRKSDSFAPLGSQKMRNHHRMITKAEPIEPRPMRCVTVDSPNSMYLVGEGMIPTHNTRTASEWINERVRNGHGRRIALLGRTAADVRDVMVLGESGIIEISRPGEVPVWEPSKRRVTWPNGAYALCIAEGELVLTSTGPVPIEKLRRGDKVLTRSGYWPVRSAWLTDRDREIVEISTALTTLRCTPDHRVLVGNGRSDTWIQAGHLQPGDMVHFRPAIDGMAVMMPVESVSSAGRARTYDVAVDGHPEFYANGLLVHNCFSADEPDQLRGPQFDTAWCVAAGEPVLVDGHWVPIETVRVGQHAMTRLGWRRVEAVTSTGVKPVLRVVTTHGVLRCTEDHRIWSDGWVRADQLRPGDIVTAWVNESRGRDPLITSSGAGSGGTATPRTTTTEIPVDTYSTSRSGRRRTARGRKVLGRSLTSITSITTRLTTPSTTSNFEPDRSTSSTITQVSRGRSRARRLRPEEKRHGWIARKLRGSVFSAVRSSSQDRGVPPFTVRSSAGTGGVWSTPNSSESVRYAASRSGFVTRRTKRSTVPRPATTPGGPSSVLTAEPSSTDSRWATGTVPTGVVSTGRVLYVEPDGIAPTWDLTVADAHEFFASNLLVHNCDEFASYPQVSGADGLTAFANLRLGLRLPVDGDMPRMVATTTPRRVPSMFQLLEESENPEFGIVITRGTTFDNLANLAQSFRATILGLYEGTRLGQQELMGEMLSDIEGALFQQSDLDAGRVTELPSGIKMHTVVGVDPSVAERPKDECGIVVVRGTAERDYYKRHLYVVEDASLLGSPALWAKRVADMAVKWNAPVVAEGNQGGELVRMAIGQVNSNIPVYIVHAKAGKATRAEPIAALAEQRRLHLLNYHPLLESEITSWVPSESKMSPGRLDALVWACLAQVTKVKGASFATDRSLRAKSMSAHRLPHLGATNLTKRGPMYRGRGR